jgi:hypothetical protein
LPEERHAFHSAIIAAVKIAVVGAGAMGSVYAGLLGAAGNEVWAVDLWQEHVDAIRVRGLRVEGASGDRWFQGLVGRPVSDTWAGIRPCLPDGLPAIGRLNGAVVAPGHAMKGVALSPITGRLVAQLVAGEQPDVDLAPFDPERF